MSIDDRPVTLRPHACFLLDRPFPIVLPRDRDVEDLWRALTHRVLREPNDLLAHARRVILCHDRRLSARLPGALHDLHQVSDGRGRALRVRLLGAVRGRLSAGDADWFESALDAPRLPPPGPFEGSVLPGMVQRLARVPGRGAVPPADAP